MDDIEIGPAGSPETASKSPQMQANDSLNAVRTRCHLLPGFPATVVSRVFTVDLWLSNCLIAWYW